VDEIITVGFFDYFTPKVFTESQLNYENGRQISKITSRLDVAAAFFASLGIVGVTASTYKIHAAINSGALLFPTSGLCFAITSIAVAVLGLYCKQTSNKQSQSFPEQKRALLACDDLFNRLQNWPIGKSNYWSAMSIASSINSIYPLVDLYYDPQIESSDPHIYVNTEKLSKEPQKLVELLLVAYKNNITLHFSHLEKTISSKSGSFNDFILTSKANTGDNKDLKIFTDSQELSKVFFNALPQEDYDQKKIERQLNALSPKLYIMNLPYPLRPPLYFNKQGIVLVPLIDYFSISNSRELINRDIPVFNPIPHHVRFYFWLRG
jgi:hypothetical protein